MVTFRTYSNNDIVEGETTLAAATKTNTKFADILSWFPTTAGAAQHMVMSLASDLSGFIFTHVIRSNVALNHTGGNGVANQALISGGSGTTSWNHVIRSNVALNHDAGNGTAGQVMQSDGDGTTSWVNISPTERVVRSKSSTNTATTTTYAADAQLAITTLTSTVTYRWTLNATLSINNTNGFKLRVVPGSAPSSSFMYILSPEINSAAGAPTAQGGNVVLTHAIAVTPAATGTYTLWASGVFVAADANLNVEFAMNATGGGNTAALTASTTILTVERIS